MLIVLAHLAVILSVVIAVVILALGHDLTTAGAGILGSVVGSAGTSAFYSGVKAVNGAAPGDG